MRAEDLLDDLLEHRDKRAGIWPCKATITAFNSGSDTVDLLLDLTYSGVAPKELTGVPMLAVGWGGWDVVVHPEAGDKCLVIFMGQDVQLWWSGNNTESESRTPSLVSAVVVGMLPRRKAVAAGTEKGITLRKHDNSVSLNVDSTGIHVTGDLDVSGNITATGNITAGTATPATQVSLLLHTHPETGGTTGTPTPGA